MKKEYILTALIMVMFFAGFYTYIEQGVSADQHADRAESYAAQLEAVSCEGVTPDGDTTGVHDAAVEVEQAKVAGKPRPTIAESGFFLPKGDNLDPAYIAYVKRFWKTAVQEMQRYGIPASISLAQGLIESNAGRSTLAVKANNHFGIKCMSKRCAKGHCVNQSDDTHKDFFVKYPSAWFSWRAHSEFLMRDRYAGLKKHGKDYKAWAKGLQAKGYATNKRYSETLIKIITDYELQRYDRMRVD